MGEPVFPTCLVCGDRIGFYEPAVVIDHDEERRTSFAREPQLESDPDALLAHADCARNLIPRRP